MQNMRMFLFRSIYFFFPFLVFAQDVSQTPETPPPIPPVPSPSYEATFWKMILVLVGMVVFLFFAVFLIKKIFSSRFQGGSALRVIKIMEKRPLSPKTMLYLVEVGKNKILIAESQNEVRRLMNFEPFEEES